MRETLYTDEDTMSRVIRLVGWRQGEVARLAGESGATDNARHASHLAQVIAREMVAPASAEGRHPLLTGHGLAVNTVANHLGHPEIRGNPDLRRTVIGILVEYGYIRPGGRRGRFEVHPRIGDVVCPSLYAIYAFYARSWHRSGGPGTVVALQRAEPQMCQQQAGWAVEEDCMDVMSVERRTKWPGGWGAIGHGDAKVIGPVAPASQKIVNADTQWDYRWV